MSLQNDLARSQAIYERLENAGVKRVLLAYKNSLKEMQSELADFYRRYEVAGSMSYADAVKYNRLINLEKGIANEINGLGKTQVALIVVALGGIYAENYYRTTYAVDNEIRRGFAAKLNVSKLMDAQIKAAVANKVTGITEWPELAMGNIKGFEKTITNAITRGIIQGQSYPEMARGIKGFYDKEAWKAERIMRTEGHRVREQGTQNAYEAAEEAGVDMMKEWSSTLDGRTRDEHGTADGQPRKVTEPFDVGGEKMMFPGDSSLGASAYNLVNCRCSSNPVIDGAAPAMRRVRLSDEEYARRKEEAGDVPVSRSEVVPYKTYDQWADDKGIKRK